MAYDLAPVKTIEEKRKILKQAVDEDWMVFFEHDPRVYCGRIETTEKGYTLKQPVAL